MSFNCSIADRKNLTLLKFKKMRLAGKKNFSLINLSEINLSQENLSGINLTGADLSGAYLDRINLSQANLRYSNLFGADLTASDLRGANLEDTNLCWTSLAFALYDEETKFPSGFSPKIHQMIFKPRQQLNLLTDR